MLWITRVAVIGWVLYVGAVVWSVAGGALQLVDAALQSIALK